MNAKINKTQAINTNLFFFGEFTLIHDEFVQNIQRIRDE